MDENLKMVLDNLKEMETKQLQDLAEGNESDNHNEDSNLEPEQ